MKLVLGPGSKRAAAIVALAAVTLVAGGVAAATAAPPPSTQQTPARHHEALATDETAMVIAADPTPVAPSVDPGPQPPVSSPGAQTGGPPNTTGSGQVGLSTVQAPALPAPLPEPNRVGQGGPAAPDRGSGAVWPGDFPDPFVLPNGPTYYAYSTQVGFTQVPTLRSSDLVHWQWVGDALAHLPAWASWGALWAPAVLQRGATYVMYYTTTDSATDRQCLSRAVSPVPQGPFVDSTTGPFVCQTDRGGSIDPNPFVDRDGTPYLQWKSEGTLNGEPTRIWSQRLSVDGMNLVGAPSELIHQDQQWEFPIVEGPSMYQIGGRYYLFYSANRWQTAAYAIGYAVCESVLGPCSKPTSSPLLASNGAMAGPGGPSVIVDTLGRTRIAYHAWSRPDVGYPSGARRLHIGTVTFGGGQPAVQP